VTVDESFETPSSLITYGRRDRQPVVLKIVKAPGDEWHSGAVVGAFGGRGVVRVLEYVDGALLLERLDPGTSLVELTLSGRDEEAMAILADVIGAMSTSRSVTACPTVEDWGQGFARYVATGDDQVALDLVAQADRLFSELCRSQHNPRLLHGDLQHSNVLFDRQRGWVAIDPKGVIGEIEYEVGAALRNPIERPDLFVDPAIVERRLGVLASTLNMDRDRAAAWSFAQAVLSAIWEVEDGNRVKPTNSSLLLAAAIRPIL
jgi:streptomycin 6-kinase